MPNWVFSRDLMSPWGAADALRVYQPAAGPRPAPDSGRSKTDSGRAAVVASVLNSSDLKNGIGIEAVRA
jgi:hypothetical protein